MTPDKKDDNESNAIEFLNGEIPGEYLYTGPNGRYIIAPSVEQIRENIPWLADQDSWLIWAWSDEGQKIPHRGDNPKAKTSWQNPESAVSLDRAWKAYQEYDHIDGVGFVFNGTEPEILEDFDNCVNPWAFNITSPCLEDALRNDDEPTFFSSSGTGAHRYPLASSAEDTSQHPHEVYIGDGGNNRWAAVTGWKITGDTHGPDRSTRVNELSDEYNEAGAKTVDMRNFDFDADPEEIDGDAPVPKAVSDSFGGDVPNCITGLVHVLGTHDPTDPDEDWGQQTFMRYSHLLMLVAKMGNVVDSEDLVKVIASFKSPAITATQRGDHPKKEAKPEPFGRGVPWDLDYQAQMIMRKVQDNDLYAPSTETIEEHCNIRIDCNCTVHGDGGRDGFERVILAADKLDGDRLRAFAEKRGFSWPTTREVRQQLRDVLTRAMRSGQNTVIDAPTGSGKSFAVATESWRGRASTTGESPVVHLHETKKARNEAAEMSDRAGVSYRVVRGRKEACSCAAGEHDDLTVNNVPASEWLDMMCDDRAVPFSLAHTLLLEWCDQELEELPCEEDGECKAKRQYDGIPWDDNGDPGVDVIHATHQFAYVPSFRLGTNVVIDEMPDFGVQISQDRIRRAVTAYLHEIGAPVTNFESFVSLARFSPSGASDAADEREQMRKMLGQTPEPDWYVTDTDANALAPALADAIWQACESDTNILGFSKGTALSEPPRFDKEQFGDAPTSSVLRVVVDEDNTIRQVKNIPYLGGARSVIGLDAQPSEQVWRANTMDGIDVTPVLDAEARQLWRRFERGLTTVQIGDATRPRSGSKATEWMNDKRIRALIEEMRTVGDLRTAVTTLQTKDRLHELLAEHSEDVELMNYGNEKSRNDFAGEDVGYVYGCMDPGDDYILTILTELGLEARPVTVDTEDGTKRQKGRTFEGPDADAAADVLASVRENHVAQAAGRYARNAADEDDEAVVFVDTNAAPDGFIDIAVPGVEWLATETQARIIDGLHELGASTAGELAEYAECTAENVRHLLRRLAEDGAVQRAERAGAFGADVWRPDGASVGDVDLAKSALSSSTSRWVLGISDRLLGSAPEDEGNEREQQRGAWPAGVETD